MTISATGIFKKVYTGSGTSTFIYDWKIDDEDELLVQKLTIATGATQTLTITTDYTVTGVGVGAGGNVVLTAGSFPSGLSSDYKIIISSNVPTTQTTDYVENDPFPAETHESALDKLTKITKQLQEQIDRSLLQSVDQTSSINFPSPSADKIIGWDSGATVLENKTFSDLSSAFDIILSGSDATKPVIVNAAGDGYEIGSSAIIAMPTITGGDAGKKLIVNAGETAFELADGETLTDLDGDTKVQVEETSDEDKVRIDTGGTQRVLIDSAGVTLQSGTNINEFSTDGTLAGDSDDALPTEKAVKTYVDTTVGAGEDEALAGANSDTEETTYSLTYIDTACAITATFSSGTYLVTGEFEYKHGDTGFATSIKAIANGVTVLETSTNATNYTKYTFARLVTVSSGSGELKLQLKNNTLAYLAYVKNMHIAAIKINTV